MISSGAAGVLLHVMESLEGKEGEIFFLGEPANK